MNSTRVHCSQEKSTLTVKKKKKKKEGRVYEGCAKYPLIPPTCPTHNQPARPVRVIKLTVWVGQVRPPKLQIGLCYRLKNYQSATTRPTRLINNFTYIY